MLSKYYPFDFFKSKAKEMKRTLISYSQFYEYNYCAWKFYIERIKKLGIKETTEPISIGFSIHSVLKDKLLNPTMSLETILSNFKTTILKQIPNSSETDKIIEEVSLIIKNIPFDNIFKKYEIIKVEENLWHNIDDKYLFMGVLDLVLKEKETGRIVIVDWKYTKNLNGWKQYKINDKRITAQLLFYKNFYFLENKGDLNNIYIEYWILTPEAPYFIIMPVESNNDLVKEAVMELDFTIKKIYDLQSFKKAKFNSAPYKCDYCQYRNDFNLCNEEPKQELK
jgi:hypothetical protein